MKKKILIASYNLDFGGIERSLITLLKNFDYSKYDVTLILEEKKGAFLREAPECVKIFQYKVSNNKIILIRKTINLFKKILFRIKNHNKFNSSICYATYSKPCSFIARTASNNSIFFVHSNYFEAYNKSIEKIKKFFNGVSINKFKHIIFVSNESRYDLIKIYPNLKNNMITINNLVDYENIIYLSTKEKINKKKGKTFLFVGRLDETSKCLTNLFKAIKKCNENNLKTNFWIVGDGPDIKLYKKITREKNLNNVTFFGFKNNPYPYINCTDYVILTSRYEGFPVIYNEAITLNKYILTTVNVSDDYITIPNRFGNVVKNNPESIYEGIKNLVNSKLEKSEVVDFKKINKLRIKALEGVMEE